MTDLRQAAGLRELVSDLADLGLTRGRHVLINCAMSRLGPVNGGPDTLLRALQEVVGPAAAVVVPTQTANNSTTSRFYLAATKGMTSVQRQEYEKSLPGFDSATPSHAMGALAEHVRRHPCAVRSAHPQTSFAALGAAAKDLMGVHDLASHLGERSPLGALYAADALTLLLGVDYDKCTALHLAEYRLAQPLPMKTYTCFTREGGNRVTRTFSAPDLDDGQFSALAVELRRQPWARSGRVGSARAHLLPIRAAVDFAVDWMSRRRQANQPATG
jgi:aminoglycoside 3-N-acetyltransferase